MCEPTTILIGMAVLGAVSSLQEGAAKKAAADSDAQIAQQNATLAQRKAEDTRVRGKQAARAQQLETAKLLGLQRASAASAGVAVDTGSALKLTEDTAQFGKLDELRIVNNAEREALGFEGKSSIFLSKKDASKQAGKNAQTAGFIGAGTSLLGGFNAAGAFSSTG